MAHIPISDRTAREFGRLIARLIEINDMTQKDLAQRADISTQRVSQIVAGDVPGPDIIRRLADALHVSYFELWYQAFHELIPEGYDVVPVDPEERSRLTLTRFRADHPEFARLYDSYMALPPEDRGRALALLEALFSGWKVKQ
jgi:transcriptional regulator with XRE-family HTH domain